jgi:hypothetical protein
MGDKIAHLSTLEISTVPVRQPTIEKQIPKIF